MKQIFGNLSLRNPENYRVALGPGSSYFVMTPDKYYWNNIHDDLKGFINDGDQSRIAEVSLGQNNYFFARKENGAWKYLVKRDSELHKLLQARANDIAVSILFIKKNKIRADTTHSAYPLALTAIITSLSSKPDPAGSGFPNRGNLRYGRWSEKQASASTTAPPVVIPRGQTPTIGAMPS